MAIGDGIHKSNACDSERGELLMVLRGGLPFLREGMSPWGAPVMTTASMVICMAFAPPVAEAQCEPGNVGRNFHATPPISL